MIHAKIYLECQNQTINLVHLGLEIGLDSKVGHLGSEVGLDINLGHLGLEICLDSKVGHPGSEVGLDSNLGHLGLEFFLDSKAAHLGSEVGLDINPGHLGLEIFWTVRLHTWVRKSVWTLTLDIWAWRFDSKMVFESPANHVLENFCF